MNNRIINSILTLSVFTTLLNAASEDLFLENSWMNVGFSNAKDAMLANATTATAKGYSSLYTNPAGLSTNYALGIYSTGSLLSRSVATGEEGEFSTVAEIESYAIGAFYKSLLIEYKQDIHTAVGLGYGYESQYGLFSFGANYVKDETTVDNYLTYGTGDYYTLGFQMQKTFLDIDDFYALYFGASMKGQGVKQVDAEQIVRISPLVQRVGVGVETNLFKASILVTYDLSKQYWHHLPYELNTQAIGIKLMLLSGLSLSVGMSSSGYIISSADATRVDLNNKKTTSAGLEFSLGTVNVAVAFLQKDVYNNANDISIQEQNAYADVSIAF